ncbi:CIS tube protein [Flammeovirga aprica]|uniref:Contractile injection system tube protein N-terminal domain-containing protein n=1 Tax=Flammeovirga aprica JL-4 TaxID=694437 RepID=A0A7X9XB50_9BACT|nr:hypothetical protein [Flammeovirga aprica]NME70273.1 hypothetical protein [Flammeovirga aprica JL-4]
MNIVIKSKVKDVSLQAITNVSTSVSASGLNDQNQNSDDDKDSKDKKVGQNKNDVSRISKNFSFTAYLDDTGMLYQEGAKIQSILDDLQKSLMDLEHRIPRIVTFDGDALGIGKDDKFLVTSLNTTFELMSNEGIPLRAKVDLSFAQEFDNTSSSNNDSKNEEGSSQTSTEQSQSNFEKQS